MVELITRVKQALADNLKCANPPKYDLDHRNDGFYLACVDDNLLPDIPRVNEGGFWDEFWKGAGQELKGNMCAVHSSSMLVVNNFARFRELKSVSPALSLCGITGFEEMPFEHKCKCIKVKGTPPHLDMVAISKTHAVAVESKLTEYFSDHRKFSRQYYEKICPTGNNARWFRTMEYADSAYEHLDAPQLIKHAFGLHDTFPDKKIILLYLYWEPDNADDHDMFNRHRKEICEFSKFVYKGDLVSNGDSVPKGRVHFSSMSYLDLWKQWEAPKQPDWLKEHTRNLRDRYDVSL